MVSFLGQTKYKRKLKSGWENVECIDYTCLACKEMSGVRNWSRLFKGLKRNNVELSYIRRFTVNITKLFMAETLSVY